MTKIGVCVAVLLAAVWCAMVRGDTSVSSTGDISVANSFTDSTMVKTTEDDYIVQKFSLSVAPGVSATVLRTMLFFSGTNQTEAPTVSYVLDNTAGTEAYTLVDSNSYMPCESLDLWSVGWSASFTIGVVTVLPAGSVVSYTYERYVKTPADITYWAQSLNSYISTADVLITPYIMILGSHTSESGGFDDDGAYEVDFDLYSNPGKYLTGQRLLVASGTRCPLVDPVFNWTMPYNESMWHDTEDGLGPGVWYVYLVSDASHLVGADFNESLTAYADKNWKQADCDDDDNLCDRRYFGMSAVVAGVVCGVIGLIILLIIAAVIGVVVFFIVRWHKKKHDEASQQLLR